MASGPNEIELKRILRGEEAAERLISAMGLPVRSESRQVNHIFDTDDRRLDRARYAMRLRTEGSRAFLTAKGPSRNVTSDTATKIEAETRIEPGEVTAVLSGASDPLTMLQKRATNPAFDELWRGIEKVKGNRALRSWGHFENLRRSVSVILPGGDPIEVEIDHTQFPNGRVDNEVEIELRDESEVDRVEAWLEEKARAAGISLGHSTPKVARFFESLEGEGR
jgi:uncharacterized protein YjbK